MKLTALRRPGRIHSACVGEFSRRSGQSRQGRRAAKAAKELAATMAKPLLLQAEFGAMREPSGISPALAGEKLRSRGRLIKLTDIVVPIRPLEWKTE